MPTETTVKPGIKSTEFWVGLVIPQVLALLITFGVIDPGQSEALQESTTQIATSGNAMWGAITSGASALGYNIARGLAKGKEPNKIE